MSLEDPPVSVDRMPEGAKYCACPVTPGTTSDKLKETRMPERYLSAPRRKSKLRRQPSAHFSPSVAAVLVLLTLSSWARAQEPSPSSSGPGDTYTIRANVDLVVLHAAAQDRKNVLVSGLDKDNF
jgi:hypothetical protein